MHSLSMRAARGVLVAALLVGIGSVAGLAASLALASQTVGTAQAETPRCTSVGLGVVPNLSGTNVASVTVSGLPSTCGSATLQVAVNNGAASSSGSSAVPAGGGSVTVTLAAAVAASAAEEIDLVVIGP
jgi:hypothetical protein